MQPERSARLFTGPIRWVALLCDQLNAGVAFVLFNDASCRGSMQPQRVVGATEDGVMVDTLHLAMPCHLLS